MRLILFYGNIFVIIFFKFSSELVPLRNKWYSKLQKPPLLEFSHLN